MMKNLVICLQWLCCSLFLLGCHSDGNTGDTPKETSNVSDGRSIIEIDTNYGPIWVELFDDLAPQTVENFIQYVEEDFYDHTLVHQVLPGFIIQAGLFDEDFNPKPTHAPIMNEANAKTHHARGTIAMMRSNNPHSATSEFFINLKDNALFDIPHGYAVFGQVIEGFDVLEKISAIPTCSAGPFYEDVPCQPVLIEKVIL